jgi:hypothetical protein
MIPVWETVQPLPPKTMLDVSLEASFLKISGKFQIYRKSYFCVSVNLYFCEWRKSVEVRKT